MLWRRRDLRERTTPSEDLLWQELRNNKLGFRFKRQYSIVNYVVDFYCAKYKLAIEIDGKIHQRLDNRKYDQYRTRYLESLGIKEIRFNNESVNNDITKVIKDIVKNLPSPEVRRGKKGEV